MKKILALTLIILMFSTTIIASEDYFQDELDSVCEEINGEIMCLANNFEENMPIQFIENVSCYSENLTYDPNEIGGCFSTVSFLERKDYNIDYKRLTTIEEKEDLGGTETITETIKRTYLPNEEIVVVIDPLLIDLTKCNVDNPYENIYEYNCNYLGKKYSASGLMLIEKGIFILEMNSNSSIDFLLNNLLYILLIIIIVGFAYSIIKKQDNTIKKPKQSKRRRKR